MADATAVRRAEEAVAMGFTDVSILDGGIGAWKAAGLKADLDAKPAPAWAALFPQ